MNINVSGYTGQLLIVWRETVAGNPTPPETGRSSALAFPYDNVYSIDNIKPVVHVVELWRSADGTTLTELIKSWNIDASLYNSIRFVEYQYLVGRGSSGGTLGTDYWEDPAAGDIELVDERLDGATKDDLTIHEAGYGRKRQDEYDLRAGGGITLNYGKQFDDGVSWFISYYTVEQASATVVTSAFYTDVEVVTADRDLYVDSTDNLYNKLVIVNGAGSTVQIDFPDLALIPNDTRVTFNTHRGSQNYLILQLDAGDSVYFNGVARNVIYLAKGEELSLYFKDGACYVTSYYGNAKIRGSVHADMDSSRHTDTGAFLLADESTGELDADDYPGLYEFIENLPASHAVALGTGSGQWGQSVTVNTGKNNEAVTYPNKCKYGIDTVARTFRVPHLKNLSRRFVNTGENPGRYQHDAVGKFEPSTVTVPKGRSYTGPPNNTRFANGDPNYPENKDITGMKIDTGNSETTVKNFGETPFIVL